MAKIYRAGSRAAQQPADRHQPHPQISCSASGQMCPKCAPGNSARVVAAHLVAVPLPHEQHLAEGAFA
jgi:hypothetical protein